MMTVEELASSQRREAFMMGAEPDKRSAPRHFIGTCAKIEVCANGEDHVALIRDWSWNGIFFYSAWAPRLASAVEFVLEFPVRRGIRCSIKCRGHVVRVQESPSGVAYGVALALENYKVLPLRPALERIAM